MHRALQIYDAVRRPFAQHVAKVSRDNGLLFTLNYPGLTFEPTSSGNDEDVPRKLAQLSSRIRSQWEWAWDSSIDGDVERAVRMLEEGASSG